MTEEDTRRFAAETEQRVREIADEAQVKLTEAADRIDARLADFDTRATKEIGRWDGRQWGMAVAGLVLVIVLSLMAGRVTAGELGVPDAECTLIDSDTGETITEDTMQIKCVETAEDGAGTSSDGG